MDTNSLYTGDFKESVKDYFYLINKQYPERGTLKLIGDRYRLNRDQRTILYRGISCSENAEKRKSRLTESINGAYLVIDGYNVLFTLLNYRLGRIVFLSNDFIVRDAGSLHGKLRDEGLFFECIRELFDFFKQQKPAFVHFYIDSPVSHSAVHCRRINEMIRDCNLHGVCEIVKSPDHDIKQFKEGIILTSDTVIIDKTSNPVFDLPYKILKSRFDAMLFNLNELIVH
ncbi:MAG: DUF434 domain-containing protein [Bacteroidales bacterium]|nr:DUF434 domain-containing protein [Bacteroidales bacterium]